MNIKLISTDISNSFVLGKNYNLICLFFFSVSIAPIEQDLLKYSKPIKR